MGHATQYSPYKTDVYQLGRTAVALATLDCLLDDAWPLDRVEQVALTHVQPLPYSPTLKDLLLQMLLEGEEARPTMSSIQQAASCTLRLMKALERTATPDLLLYVPMLVAELLQTVPLDRVGVLISLLIAVPSDRILLNIVTSLQADTALLREKLIPALKSPENLTIETLEQLFQPSREVPRKPIPQGVSESSLFFVNQDNSVSLYRGRTREGNLQVIIKRHKFNNIQDKAVQISMGRTFNAALAQAKMQHPNARDILEVQMEIKRDKCSIFHILETSVEDLGADLENCSRTSGTNAELGMDGYELESNPFYVNPALTSPYIGDGGA